MLLTRNRKAGVVLAVIAVGLALVMCVPECGHRKSRTKSAEREKIQLPEGEYLVNRFTPEDSYKMFPLTTGLHQLKSTEGHTAMGLQWT